MTTALLFPGQGSQAPGMGEWCRHHPAALELAADVSAAAGIDLLHLVTEATVDELTPTEHAQPALLFVCLAAMAVHQRDGLRFDVTAGHSLGEYAALVAAGSLDPLQAILLVRERGLAMAAAAEMAPEPTGLSAVLGLDAELVGEVAEGTGLEVANYNSPRQVVVGGTLSALAAAEPALRAAGAQRVVALRVSAAFHTSWMLPARERLALALERTDFADARVPVYGNVDARPATAAAELRRRLAEQVASPVRWYQGVGAMAADGVDRFIEIGPRRTLAGLLRESLPEAEVSHLGAPATELAPAGDAAPQ